MIRHDKSKEMKIICKLVERACSFVYTLNNSYKNQKITFNKQKNVVEYK